jgi:hypothetical protein
MKPYSIKLIRLTLVAIFIMGAGFTCLAQQELQIHHINIENGDATMIGIYDQQTHSYTGKVLIDGGLSSAGTYLLPYLEKMGDTHFNYVILTHYHNDHYTGLNALGTGQMTADSLVDPGGYDFGQYFPAQPHLQQLSENKPGSLNIAQQWLTMVGRAMNGHFLKGHSERLVSYGTSPKTSLGHRLLVGTLGGLPVTLECVAGWGNPLGGQGIAEDPLPGKDNANNFSLAFVLQCGEFRYFIGGDLGGSDDNLYIDQEDVLTGYFAKEFPAARSIDGHTVRAGHICGAKADHHGSNYANAASFMQSMNSSITVTSAGNRASWHLPQVDYLNLLAGVHSLSGSRGVYFTNLYDFGPGKTSLSTARQLFFGHAGLSFDYGNPPEHKYSYMVRVTADHLATESDFEVDRVDISQQQPYFRLATFQCHKK